jgi:hypothetical protein
MGISAKIPRTDAWPTTRIRIILLEVTPLPVPSIDFNPYESAPTTPSTANKKTLDTNWKEKGSK